MTIAADIAAKYHNMLDAHENAYDNCVERDEHKYPRAIYYRFQDQSELVINWLPIEQVDIAKPAKRYLVLKELFQPLKNFKEAQELAKQKATENPGEGAIVAEFVEKWKTPEVLTKVTLQESD